MTDKRLDTLIRDVLSSPEKYKTNSKKYKQGVTNNDEATIELVINAGYSILSEDAFDPTTKLCAMRLIKECMDLNNPLFIQSTKDYILPNLVEIARFEKQSQDDNRGTTYFKPKKKAEEKDTKTIGNSFLRLVLECIRAWAAFYPSDEDFVGVYKGLVKDKVKFPDKINYFKEEDLKSKETAPTKKSQEKMNQSQGGSGAAATKTSQSNLKGINYESLIENVRSQKEFLLSMLTAEKEQELERETLEYVIGEIRNLSKDVEKTVDELMLKDEATQDKYLGRLFEDNEFMSKAVTEYDKYKSKKSTYAQYRSQFLGYKEEIHATPGMTPDEKAQNFNTNQGASTIIANDSYAFPVNNNSSNNKMGFPAQSVLLSQEDPKDLILRDVLSSRDNYKANKKPIVSQVTSGNEESMLNVIEIALKVLEDPSEQPISKFLIVRLVQECLTPNNNKFAKYISDTVLSNICEIAAFKKESKDINRGDTFFSELPNQELKEIGSSIVLLCLECILVWARWFPRDPEDNKTESTFKQTYEYLTQLNVSFPDRLRFIKDHRNEMEDKLKEINLIKQRILQLLVQNEGQFKESAVQQEIKNVEAIIQYLHPSYTSLSKSNDQKDRMLVKEYEEENTFLNEISDDLVLWKSKKQTYKNFRARFVKDIQDDYNEDKVEEKKEEDTEKKKQIEQKIAEDRELEMFIQENLSTNGKFENNQIELLTLVDSQKIDLIIMIIKAAKHAVADPKKAPLTTFHSLLLVKKCMDLKIETFQYKLEAEEQLLLSYCNIYKLNNQTASKYFGTTKDLEDVGTRFIRLVGECIKVWAEWWPVDIHNNQDSVFKRGYDNLVKEGVKFPTEYMYFENKKKMDPKEQKKSLDAIKRLKQEFSDFIIRNKKELNSINEVKQYLDSIRTEYDKIETGVTGTPEFLKDVENSKDFCQDLFDNYHKYDNSIISYLDFRSVYLRKFAPNIWQAEEEEEAKKKIQEEKQNAILNMNSGSLLKSSIIGGSILKSSFKQMFSDVDETEKLPLKSSIALSKTQYTKYNMGSGMVKPLFKRKEEEKMMIQVVNQPDPELEKEYKIMKENLLLTEHDKERLMKEREELLLEQNQLRVSLKQMGDECEMYKGSYQSMLSKNPDQISKQHKELVEKFNELSDEYEKLKHNFSMIESENKSLKEERFSENSQSLAITNKYNSLIQENEDLKQSQDNIKKEFEELKKKNILLQQSMAEDMASRRGQNSQISGSRSRANSPKIFEPLRNYGESPKYQEVTSLNNSQHSMKKSINQNHQKIFEPARKFESPRNDHDILANSIEIQKPGTRQGQQKRGKIEGYMNQGAYGVDQDEDNQVTLSAYLKNLKNLNNSNVLPNERSSQNLPPAKMDHSQHGFEEPNDSRLGPKASNPLYNDLIYPFNKPKDYYDNQEPKEHRGRLITFNRYLFQNIPQQHESNLNKFKLGCLKSKSAIYESEFIQVGCVSSLQFHQDKNYLKLSLYFTNKSNVELGNCMIQYIGNSALSLWTKPETIKPDLETGEQARQDLIVDFNEIPYPVLLGEFSFRTPFAQMNFSFSVPTSINKFVENRPSTLKEFRLKWRERQVNMIRSEAISVNPKMVKAHSDFKKYFENLIDLKPHKESDHINGAGNYNMGAVLFFSHTNEEYLLKIIMQPDKKAVFKLTCDDDNEGVNANVEEYILQTLTFMFKA